jgi:CheY-like chemotaxis protein
MLRRVLLVDDDPAVLLTLKAVLSLHRFEVETADSVREACRKLREGVFELVITDVRMEHEGSGLEVVHTARRQAYRPSTAVLTAYPPDGELWKSERVDAILVKPIGTRQLIEQLEKLLPENRQTRSTGSTKEPS